MIKILYCAILVLFFYVFVWEDMFWWLMDWIAPRIEPINTMTLDKRKLHFNYGYLAGLHPDADIFPVMKGNAYGHGLLEMLKIYKKIRVPYILTDSINEMNTIHSFSRHKVLFAVETLPKNYRLFDFARTTPCVGSLAVLQALLQIKRKKNIHLVINTWMGAEWFDSDQLKEALHLLKTHPHKKYTTLEGVMSHLANAEKPGVDQLRKQVERFKLMYHAIVDQGFLPFYKHIGASAGMFKIADDFFNAWRPGLALYGYNPLESTDAYFAKAQQLQPAMSLTTRVIAIHDADEQSLEDWTAWSNEEKAKIVTVHFGFADGLLWSGSGQYVAQLHNKNIHQIGRVGLHYAMYAVPRWVGVAMGDVVTLLSPSATHSSVFAWSQAAHTTQAEILCSIKPLLQRKIIVS